MYESQKNFPATAFQIYNKIDLLLENVKMFNCRITGNKKGTTENLPVMPIYKLNYNLISAVSVRK